MFYLMHDYITFLLFSFQTFVTSISMSAIATNGVVQGMEKQLKNKKKIQN